jgi:pSer/pThr/pTyr-binding forkhead associated (FHA) protein
MTHPGKTKLVPVLGPNINIGRANANDLIIDSERVSRFHALLTIENGRAWIRDLQSSNGTFVNGTRVDSRMLENGDTIILGGSCQIRYLAGDEDVTPADALRLMTIPGSLMDLEKLRGTGPR